MLRRGLGSLVIMLVALCWGLNWPAVRTALNEIPPWTLRAIGMGAGALFLLALARLTGKRCLMVRDEWLPVLGSGFLSITAFNLLLSFAQLAAPTSRAVIVTFTMPIWTIIFARLLLGERLDRRRWIGLTVGSLGLVCLGWPLIQDRTFNYGLVLALLAGMSWALGTVIIKRFPVAAPPITITLWQLIAGALVATIGVVLFEPQVLRDGLGLAGWHLSTWVGLSYHILFSQALAYLLWYWLLARIPAGTAALALLLVPAIGVISSILLLSERPTTADVLGLLLMTVAAAVVMIPATRVVPHKASAQATGKV